MSYERLFMNISAIDTYAIVDVLRWETTLSDSGLYHNYRILPADEGRHVLRRIVHADPQVLDELVHAFVDPCMETRNYSEDYLLELLERALGEDSQFDNAPAPLGARMYVLKQQLPEDIEWEPDPEFDPDALHQAAMAEARARPRGYVVFEFVTEQGASVPGLTCEVLLADGEFLTRTSDGLGQVRLDPIPQGTCHLRLPTLDGSSWRPESGPQSSPVDKTRATTHIVRRGECLARIAHEYGIKDWRKVWDDPRNEPLRKKRKDPNVLRPGDEVAIPPRDIHEIVRDTDQTYRVIVERGTVEISLSLHDRNGAPFADEPYELFLDSGASRSGITDAQGNVRERVPVATRFADLRLANIGLAWRLLVGELHAIENANDVRDLQSRLNALGYDAGPVDGQLGPRTREALARFQAEADTGDEQPGELTLASITALVEHYGA